MGQGIKSLAAAGCSKISNVSWGEGLMYPSIHTLSSLTSVNRARAGGGIEALFES